MLFRHTYAATTTYTSTTLSIITRVILIFFWEGEDCVTSNGNKERSFSFWYQGFIYLFIFYYERFQSRYSHIITQHWSCTKCMIAPRNHNLCASLMSGYFIHILPRPHLRKRLLSLSFPPIHLTTLLFIPCLCERCVDLVVSLFFFWFCCCVGVVCEAGAWTAEARRCHRLPSRPCWGEDRQISVFLPLPIFSYFLPFFFFLRMLTPRNTCQTYPLHFLLTLSINYDYILWWSSLCTMYNRSFSINKTRFDNQSTLNLLIKVIDRGLFFI